MKLVYNKLHAILHVKKWRCSESGAVEKEVNQRGG
jgi:hypothetical protein